MNRADAFEYADSPAISAEDWLVRVPAGLTSTDDLMDLVFRGLRFPGWAGENWNAMWDCIRDLSWIESRRVVLVHEDVPEIPEGDLREYLLVLADAVADWRSRAPAHELRVTFPARARTAIESALID